mmetsp:Transcript_3983/g.3399  ORF Transcript_3983/g.3399 Transcript_3983/m.3399 type:complete len:223 (+) Transcript_3983:40-708(+)
MNKSLIIYALVFLALASSVPVPVPDSWDYDSSESSEFTSDFDDEFFHKSIGHFHVTVDHSHIGGGYKKDSNNDVGARVNYGSGKEGGSVSGKIGGVGLSGHYNHHDTGGFDAGAGVHAGVVGAHGSVAESGGHYKGDVGASVGGEVAPGIGAKVAATEKFSGDGNGGVKWAGQSIKGEVSTPVGSAHAGLDQDSQGNVKATEGASGLAGSLHASQNIIGGTK